MRVGLLIAALSSLLAATPALANPALTDPELDALRGGYIAANGITFGFGAQIETYVNGALALESTLRLTDNNTLDAQNQAVGPTGAPGNPTTVVIAGDGGVTTLLHSINSGQILSVVLNSANNQTIQQNTHVVLTLPGFLTTQNNAAFQQLSAGLQASLGFAVARAAAH